MAQPKERPPVEQPKVRQTFSGGGGIYSTAPDYLTLIRALMHDGALDGAFELRHPRIRQAIRAVDAVASVRPVSKVRADVLPHDVAGGRHFEHPAVRTFSDERIAVHEPLGRAHVVAEEPIAVRPANRILPDLLQTHGIDLEMDTKDFEAGKKIACPSLILWGATGSVGRNSKPAPAEIWQRYAADIRGAKALPCGHYLSEEAPDETYQELRAFFAP